MITRSFCRAALALLFLVLASASPGQQAESPPAAPLPGAPLWDVVVAPVVAKPPAPDALWGKGLPQNVNVAAEAPALARSLARNEYLVNAIQADAPDAAWPESPETCRAVLLPDLAALSDAQAKRLADYARAGGLVIAFGHASLLDPNGAPRTDYLLCELFGARCGGKVDFESESAAVAFASDSVFGKPYGPENIADGGENFWASQDAPMPHWVRMDFSAPRQVAGVDVTCRPGFMLRDFDVQAPQGDGWVTLAAVRGNEKNRIACSFEKAVETKSLRVLVLKEMLNEKDRQIADIAEVEPRDAAGRKLIVPAFLLEARIADDAWAAAAKSRRLSLRSPALRLQPTTARPLAFFADPRGAELPLCAVNTVGEGRAILFAVPEAALLSMPEVWGALLRTFVGLPTVRHSGDEDFRLELARTGQGFLLRVTDQNTERAAKAKERRVYLKLNCARLGVPASARLVPSGTDLPVNARREWTQISLPMPHSATLEIRK